MFLRKHPDMSQESTLLNTHTNKNKTATNNKRRTIYELSLKFNFDSIAFDSSGVSEHFFGELRGEPIQKRERERERLSRIFGKKFKIHEGIRL